jgi:thioesterase domain-containing protein/NAD(P)-dependent dehydrogenase (short-subunit alcohol dehydrogenase family)/acyl carrier protein
MGFAIAGDLAKRFKAKLILVGRSPFPQRKEWEEWLSGSHNEENVKSKIRKLLEFEKMGAEVMVASVDVSDEERMRKVIARAEKKFGAINGILHTAGLADYEGVIQKRTRQMTEKILSPKVNGTIVLNRIFKNKKLDFMVLFSSGATIQYKNKFGQVGYIAANDFLDAFAHARNMKNETFTVAINWTDWQEVGMAVEAVKKHLEREGKKIDPNTLLRNYLSPIEGVEVFYRILGNKFCQVAVSTQDFVHLIESMDEMNREDKEEVNTSMVSTVLERPCLKSEYVAPGNEIEQTLAEIWEEFFGLQEVGIHDDFFELGGDSLKAISLISHIEKKGYKISLNDILLRPTVHGLASVILGENTTEESPALKSYEELLLAGLDCVKKLNKGHNEKNIFIIHPMHGMVNQYIQLAVLLENKYNVYGIQARGVQSGLKMSESPVQMVNDYLEQILTVQKGGSYIIAGYCTGTTIAYEIVRKLERLNHHVEKLILFDTDMLFTDIFFKMIRPFRYLPDFVKRVILFFREREFKKAVKVENPGIINVNDGKEIACEDDLHKNRLIKHIRILGSYILPLEIIKSPILVPLAEASNYHRATERDFSKITGSKAEVIKIPGDHNSIFEKPDVEKLAELIINNI